MGLVQKGNSCSFQQSHASGNRETTVEGAKNTGVSSLKPAVDNERRRRSKEQTSSHRLTTNDRKVKRPALRLEAKSLVYGSKMKNIVV